MNRWIASVCCTLGITFSFAQNTWTQKASLPGLGRAAPSAFSIGNKGFIGNGEDPSNNDLSDLWEWNQATNTWTQKTNMGIGSSAPMSFAINGKGYVVMGWYLVQINDTWEYDPASNSWTQKANFPGAGRYGAAGFAIGNKGYIGMGCPGGGNGPPSTDFWEFDPALNSWSQKASSPMPPRRATEGIGIGTKGYMGFGYDGTIPVFYNDWWEYDPAGNSWAQRASLPASARAYPAVFMLWNYAFAGLGNNGSSYLTDFWRYDPGTDSWSQVQNFGGVARTCARGFSIGSKGYVGMGVDGGNYYNDFWEYAPLKTGAEEQDLSIQPCRFYPSVISSSATLVMDEQYGLLHTLLNVYDAQGNLARSCTVTDHRFLFEKEDLKSGVYFFEVVNGDKRVGGGKFIIE